MNPQQPPSVPNACKKSRRLTVSYASTATAGTNVPYLRLRGRWLQDAGFTIGRHVTIEGSEGRMTIEQVD